MCSFRVDGSPELVDVTALAKIRDDVLHRKGQFLELIMEDILSALYLRLHDSSNGMQSYCGMGGEASPC